MSPSLFATFVLLAEIDVARLLGAALLGAAICGPVAAGRWIKAQHAEGNSSDGAVASSAGYYAKIAVIMAIGLACMFGGLALMTMNQ